MDSPYPNGCQHRNHQLRNHGHVDGDPVALLNTFRLQVVGQLADLVQQVLVCHTAGVRWVVALPVGIFIKIFNCIIAKYPKIGCNKL